MKFQVHGELDVPKEVTELLTGLTYSSDVMIFQDIEMKLGQTALDRLSVILHLIYATQPLEEVKDYLSEIFTPKMQNPVTPQLSYAVSPSPTLSYVASLEEKHQVVSQPYTNQTQHNSLSGNSVPFNLNAYTVSEIKSTDDVRKQSISSLSTKIKGRVG